MAGSWSHAIAPDGQLLMGDELNGMLENGGDWTEFAEEAYGMVYWLADQLAKASAGKYDIKQCIGYAQLNYQEGIAISPGIEGSIGEEVI